MHAASGYGASLFEALPVSDAAAPPPRGAHPALAWARSGAMVLTGRADEPPRLAPGPLASAMEAALDGARSLAMRELPPIDAGALLGERAAHQGLVRSGAISPGGSCRILPCAEGFVAVSLARDEDRASIPAWLEVEPSEGCDPWRVVAAAAEHRPAAALAARARLLGLAVAEVGDGSDAHRRPWLRATPFGARDTAADRTPLVIDLSALWAGPLCGRLLALAGARVVKVESVARPDGARRGPAAFYDALNAGKESVALDLASASGRDALRRLLARADAVIESARPRALAQLGIDAEAILADRDGLVWVSVTGYGRRDPEGTWVAFGDDAAAASGLAARTGDPGAPLFCGDAIADPLTGAHAALAALGHLRAGQGALLDLALRDVTAHAIAAGDARAGARVFADGAGYAVEAGGACAAVAPPRRALPAGDARPLGADTAAVLAELAARC